MQPYEWYGYHLESAVFPTDPLHCTCYMPHEASTSVCGGRHAFCACRSLLLRLPFGFHVPTHSSYVVSVSLLREIVLQPKLMSPESVAFPNSRFEEIDGLKVHYLREDPGTVGGGEAPRCVLHMNHGFGASSSSWSPVINGLSRELGALAIAHDTPGFGLTARAGLLETNRYSLRSNAGEEIESAHGPWRWVGLFCVLAGLAGWATQEQVSGCRDRFDAPCLRPEVVSAFDGTINCLEFSRLCRA